MLRHHETVKISQPGPEKKDHTEKKKLETDRCDLPVQLVKMTWSTRFQYLQDGIFK